MAAWLSSASRPVDSNASGPAIGVTSWYSVIWSPPLSPRHPPGARRPQCACSCL